jgi:hypothetical protein
MAWSNSKVFCSFIEGALENTTAFDLDGDSFKVTLYDNSITPDQTVSLANSAAGAGVWATDIYDGTEWADGGVAMTIITHAYTAATWKWDANDVSSGSSATLTVYGCHVGDTTLSNYGISYHYFGGVQTVTDGTFTVAWNSSGVINAVL